MVYQALGNFLQLPVGSGKDVSFDFDIEKFNGTYKMKPITTGPDHKLKPAFLNDSEVVYLSDQNRGVVFYTLRRRALK